VSSARREPTRASIVVGVASWLSLVGYVAGWAVMYSRAQTFPDYARFAATGAVTGAAAGWTLGASIGVAFSAPRRRVGRRGAAVLLVTAGLAVVAGLAVAAFETRFARSAPGVLSREELPWLRAATLSGAGVVAGTLALVAFLGRADPRPPSGDGRGARVGSVLAIVLLAGAFVLTLSEVVGQHRARVERQVGAPASSTLYALLAKAERFHDRHGRFPSRHRALGDEDVVEPGAQVAFAGRVGDGFCAIVGLEEGGPAPGEPVYTGVARLDDVGKVRTRTVESCEVLT
jgi:hypothetical protein